MKIIGLYSAKVQSIGPKSEQTGIYKYPLKSAQVNELGITNDIQIDKRFHGGPERALHQYALYSYEKIIKHYPLLHKVAWPGSMGENISVTNMNEHNVCIGDIYQMGECTLQVSSPRMPCWKIAAKFNWKGLDKFVAKHAIHGWYYRVLKTGKISVSNDVSLVSRINPDITIAHFLEIAQGKIKDKTFIESAIRAEGLDPEWQTKLSKQL